MKEVIPLSAAAINEMHDAIGALVLAISYELPPERQQSLCQQLQRLAQSKNRSGNHTAAACLLDYARAVAFAQENPR